MIIADTADTTTDTDQPPFNWWPIVWLLASGTALIVLFS